MSYSLYTTAFYATQDTPVGGAPGALTLVGAAAGYHDITEMTGAMAGALVLTGAAIGPVAPAFGVVEGSLVLTGSIIGNVEPTYQYTFSFASGAYDLLIGQRAATGMAQATYAIESFVEAFTGSGVSGFYSLDALLDRLSYVNGTFDLGSYEPRRSNVDGQYELRASQQRIARVDAIYDLAAFKSRQLFVEAGYSINVFVAEAASVHGTYDLLAYDNKEFILSGTYDLNAFREYLLFLDAEYSLGSLTVQIVNVSGQYSIDCFRVAGGFIHADYAIDVLKTFTIPISAVYSLDAFSEAVALVQAEYLLDATESFYGWIVNIETKAAGRYSGMNFNSLFGKRGAMEDGIYEFSGSTNNGQPINAWIETARTDFGTSALKRVTDCYLGMESDEKITLTVEAENVPVNYLLDARSLTETSKTNLSRAFKDRYWQFKIGNTNGGDFFLDSIEFIPRILNRRK